MLCTFTALIVRMILEYLFLYHMMDLDDISKQSFGGFSIFGLPKKLVGVFEKIAFFMLLLGLK